MALKCLNYQVKLITELGCCIFHSWLDQARGSHTSSLPGAAVRVLQLSNITLGLLGKFVQSFTIQGFPLESECGCMESKISL